MPLKFQDYYQTLGVTRSATAEELKQAFRKLARIHHPDVATDKVAGEAKFKEINEAYEVLGDPEKRRSYDELGANWQRDGGAQTAADRGRHPGSRGPAGDAGFEYDGTGFSDFFESFFAGSRDGFGSRHRTAGHEHPGSSPFDTEGQDVEADLLVNLEEVLTGAQRKISLRRPAMAGEPERTNTYQVKIPQGIRSGQRIRLAGQGAAGSGGHPAGDLYLRVRLARHPDFTVLGADLHSTLALAPWEAVLGVKVTVPTLGGSANLRVPPSSAAGTQLRMPGQGLPRKDRTRGDLLTTLQISLPKVITAAERDLWEKLASASTFNPRSIS